MNDYMKIENTDTGCHVKLDRVQLQRDYVDRIVDGMDINDLCQIVADYMHDNLESYTDEQLVAEVKDYYPDMIEDENNE